MLIFLLTPQIKTGDVVKDNSPDKLLTILSTGESNEDDSIAVLLILGICCAPYTETV